MLSLVRLDHGDIVNTDIFLDHYGSIKSRSFVSAQPGCQLFRRHSQPVYDKLFCRLHVFYRLAVKQDVERGAVFHEGLVVAVGYCTAWRHELDGPHSILLGQLSVLRATNDLELPQTARQDSKNQDDCK